MKIEVESEALDSLKAMAQRLQEERDELLGALQETQHAIYEMKFGRTRPDWFTYGEQGARQHEINWKRRLEEEFFNKNGVIIAKCTAKPEVLE